MSDESNASTSLLYARIVTKTMNFCSTRGVEEVIPSSFDHLQLTQEYQLHTFVFDSTVEFFRTIAFKASIPYVYHLSSLD